MSIIRQIKLVIIVLLCTIFIIPASIGQSTEDDAIAKQTQTQKKRKRKKVDPNPSKIKKAYHDMTHKYNGYFNAEVKYNEAINKLEDKHQDNYNKVLPIYKYMAVDDASSVSGELDQTIKKTSIAINLHRISKWSDDSYMLMGKALFAKKEFEKAEEAFQYLIAEYDPKKLAKKAAKGKKKKKRKKANTGLKKSDRNKKATEKKKKKKGGLRKVRRPRDAQGNIIVKPETETPVEAPKKEVKTIKAEEVKSDDKQPSYFMKHRPIRKDAMLWLAKTKIELDKYDEALIIISRLKKDPEFHKSLKSELYATEAYAAMKQERFKEVTQPLEQAIANAKKKKDRTRYTYILGQIYQQEGQGQQAYAQFEKVVDDKPAYEMYFNAKLSIAKNAWANGDGSLDEAERTLTKMLKDEKNEEYLDQVYFALADVELNRENKAMAKEYLKKSVYHGSGNKPQQAEAYLLLAELHFEEEIYTKAKYYYDSTLTVLDKKDERYATAEKYSKSLTDIAKNIETITLQDSLLKIMAMSDEDKLALAIKIKKQQDEQKKARQNAANARAVKKGKRGTASLKNFGGRSNLRQNSANSIGTWWAYETDDLRKRKRAFEKKWGNRELADNWRRSKNSGIGGIDETIVENNFDAFEMTQEEAETLFKGMKVPQNDKEVLVSNGKIIDAMSALGVLYRERLQNRQKSIEILEELMTRFPDNKYKLESAYMLYVLFSDVPNINKANYYKDLVTKEGKDSKYAKVIADPDFLNKANAEELSFVETYDKAYDAFKAGNYAQALDLLEAKDKTLEKTHELKPKYALMIAMCVGNKEGKEAYKVALNDLIKTYPKSEEKKKAVEILRYLGGGTPVADKTKATRKVNTPVKKGVFVTDDNGSHFFIATFTPDAMTRDQIKAAFSDFNKKYHKLQRLRANVIYLDLQTPVAIVKRFRNRKEAMAYLDSINSKIGELTKGVKNLNLKPMILAQKNYRTILRKKNIKEYEAFFDEVYNQ